MPNNLKSDSDMGLSALGDLQRADIMRLTNEGQVTIPLNIRAQAGLTPGSEVEFKFDNGRVWLAKVDSQRRNQILATLADIKGCATENRDLRTDDILQMTRGECFTSQGK